MNLTRVLSFGAGVQSTTLLLMSLRGDLPRLDLVIFADTHAEPADVYRHKDWCRHECERASVPFVEVSAGNLAADALSFRRQRYSVDPVTGRKGYASIPLFILNSDESVGRVRRQCTSEYKIIPIEKYLRQQILGLESGQRAPRECRVEQWLGISTDEARRAKPPGNKDRSPIWWKTHAFPLMDQVRFWSRNQALFEEQPIPVMRAWSDLGNPSLSMNRAACAAWLEAHYPNIRVPRSACVFCPYRSNEEWGRMRAEKPDEFAGAVDFDRSIREADAEGKIAGDLLTGLPFLHRSCTPLGDVDFAAPVDRGSIPEVDDEGETLFHVASESECEGMCGV